MPRANRNCLRGKGRGRMPGTRKVSCRAVGCETKVGESTIPFCNKHWYRLSANLRISLGVASWTSSPDEYEALLLKAINHLNAPENK
jgi:hypothetical protein